MKAQDFLTHVQRKRGDYLDFYPVAALLHAGYITTDSETSTHRGKTIEGKLGANLQDTAIFLCQLVLPPGGSFQINNCPRDSAYNFPVKVFVTADGLRKASHMRNEAQLPIAEVDHVGRLWLTLAHRSAALLICFSSISSAVSKCR